MRFAYADPPYPGQAKRHYGPDAREVNHPLLIAHLETFDAWALSTSSPALPSVLTMCPPKVRIAAWVKPFASFKPNVHPAYAWEPIIFRGAVARSRSHPHVTDWVASNITMGRDTHGAKPDKVWYWLFSMMGLGREDEFIDVFPGSGAGRIAWEHWCGVRQLELA